MQIDILKHANGLAAGLVLALAAATANAEQGSDSHAAHDHAHQHDHSHDDDNAIYKGYFDDDQVADRALSDWEGDWQSVYPLLQDGSLDEVMTDKAAHGDKAAEEYRAYYETGYKTDVDRLVIDGSDITFHSDGNSVSGNYESDGLEILTYEKGNRGVRFIFRKTEGDEEAPRFIQFSDHRIAPAPADHYHLYWGDDRDALLEEVTNWPTFYPAELSAEQIVDEMIAH